VQATYGTDEYGVPDGTLISGSSELLANTFTGGLGVRNETGQPTGIAPRGLYYMQQRWMDPVLGRWLNQDPIGFAGGLNLYRLRKFATNKLYGPERLQPPVVWVGGADLCSWSWISTRKGGSGNHRITSPISRRPN